MKDDKRRVLFCPILSIGLNDSKICLQESCAWYMPSTKTCAAYVVGHKAILDIKEKQGK